MRRAEADPEIEVRRHEPIPERIDPAIEALVEDIIGKVADKWTMLILEALQENGTLRYTQLRTKVEGISQKMLTQTVRQMEEDGLVRRTVHPVIPPHVDYTLTPLGDSLSKAFCGVWIWAQTNYDEIQRARQAFAAQGKLNSDKRVS
ncbi:winged helix-turn-helix transcriptional regulator [Phyllobacterium phragmitis]|uniref:Helix-turn-helix domain-containing protein n=1 Tax=Phyllobacterium phragmitis TaxID=2670329 RepID=A0ABQ0H5I9_9HYPH